MASPYSFGEGHKSRRSNVNPGDLSAKCYRGLLVRKMKMCLRAYSDN